MVAEKFQLKKKIWFYLRFYIIIKLTLYLKAASFVAKWLERSSAKLVHWIWFSVASYQKTLEMASAASLAKRQ